MELEIPVTNPMIFGGVKLIKVSGEKPEMADLNVPQIGIPFPTLSYAVAAVLFGIAALCGVMLIRSRRQTR